VSRHDDAIQRRHADAVNLYLKTTLSLVEVMHRVRRNKREYEQYKTAVMAIRAATVFEVETDTMQHLLDRVAPVVGDLLARYPGDRYQRLHAAAEDAAPLPTDRPFRSMFLAFSRPLEFRHYRDETAKMWAEVTDGQLREMWTAGILISPQFLVLTVTHSRGTQFGTITLETDKWDLGPSLLPWALPWLVRLIEEQSTRVQPRKTSRLKFQAQAKKHKVTARTPPPYYAVSILPQHVSKGNEGLVRGGGTRAAWRFRWHVEGHERLYVRRGPLPLDPRVNGRLERRGYQVFEAGVDRRCAEALARRAKPPAQPDEWVAVKYVRIAEDIRPHRHDLPVVPSTRRVGV
jgi:hypothetical protein